MNTKYETPAKDLKRSFGLSRSEIQQLEAHQHACNYDPSKRRRDIKRLCLKKSNFAKQSFGLIIGEAIFRGRRSRVRLLCYQGFAQFFILFLSLQYGTKQIISEIWIYPSRARTRGLRLISCPTCEFLNHFRHEGRPVISLGSCVRGCRSHFYVFFNFANKKPALIPKERCFYILLETFFKSSLHRRK